jgi:hypothetical protein
MLGALMAHHLRRSGPGSPHIAPTIRRGCAIQSSDFGHQPDDSVILCGDRLVRRAKLALAIRELDFCGLAAPLRFAQCAAQFVDLDAGRDRHHDEDRLLR